MVCLLKLLTIRVKRMSTGFPKNPRTHFPLMTLCCHTAVIFYSVDPLFITFLFTCGWGHHHHHVSTQNLRVHTWTLLKFYRFLLNKLFVFIATIVNPEKQCSKRHGSASTSETHMLIMLHFFRICTTLRFAGKDYRLIPPGINQRKPLFASSHSHDFFRFGRM